MFLQNFFDFTLQILTFLWQHFLGTFFSSFFSKQQFLTNLKKNPWIFQLFFNWKILLRKKSYQIIFGNKFVKKFAIIFLKKSNQRSQRFWKKNYWYQKFLCFKNIFKVFFSHFSSPLKFFTNISNFFKIFPNFSKYFQIFYNFLKNFKIFYDFSKHFKVFPNLSRYFQLFQNISNFLKMFPNF